LSETYYPPGSAPSAGRHCDHESNYASDRIYDNGLCKLLPGHDGDHNVTANWNAHVEVRPTTTGVEVAFQSWHDSRGLHVRTRKEADQLLAFLAQQFNERWPHP
jgi:hypothetical protein